MSESVANPIDGTLISVARDACGSLAASPAASEGDLRALMRAWSEACQTELAKTPDQLVDPKSGPFLMRAC